ncbi:MAG TPA: YciI family protein [Longimicrobium sp.]|nr:YciI family protein [Longimicrobium sp.]
MAVRYLCLIYWNEHELETLPAAELSALEAAHLDFNDDLRQSGQLIEAEALQHSRESACVRVRRGKTSFTDGPFAESKEVVAGFYLLEVRDKEEALEIAARIPSATHATVERVRPIHTLVVAGRS